MTATTNVSTKTYNLIASFAEASLSVTELGKKLAVSVANDGITTRKELHSTVVDILSTDITYAADLQDTGYFVGGSAAQAAYSRVMRAAFPKAVANSKVPATIKLTKAQRAAIQACKELGVTLAMFRMVK